MKKLKYKYYRFMWWLAQYLPNGKFIHVDIELTNACNQSCLSCWHSDKKNLPFEIKQMPEEMAIDYLTEARKHGAMSVKFNWRGESTLHPSLYDLIKYASSIGYIDIMLNTNAVKLEYSDLVKFNENGLTTLIMSLDSTNKETYLKMHGCDFPDFSKLKKVLKYLNIMKLSDMLNFKVKLNYHINQLNENENIDPDFCKFEMNIKKTIKREGQDISLPVVDRKRKSYCPHMKRRLTVASNGKIFHCCLAYKEPNDLYLGREIQVALTMKKLDILNYKKYKQSSCKDCTSADIWK